MSSDFEDGLGIVVSIVLVFVVWVVLTNIWAGNRPYSYKAKYCASTTQCTYKDSYTEKNECPKQEEVEVGFLATVTGDIVDGSCSVWKRDTR